MLRSRSARASIALAVLAMLLVPADAHAAMVVEMVDNEFLPVSLTVHVRTSKSERTVRWINVGNLDHTTTREGVIKWDSGIVDPGDAFTKLFRYAGLYPYECVLHGGMRGSIRVKPWAGSDGSTTVDPGETARVRVAVVDAPDGFVYDIQKKVGSGTWRRWRRGWTNETAPFRRNSDGVVYFRARIRKLSNGDASLWSPRTRLTVD